jgi:hypothetical protein
MRQPRGPAPGRRGLEDPAPSSQEEERDGDPEIGAIEVSKRRKSRQPHPWVRSPERRLTLQTAIPADQSGQLPPTSTRGPLGQYGGFRHPDHPVLPTMSP